MKYLLFITTILISSFLHAQDDSITEFDLKNALQSVLDNHKTIKAQKIDIKAAEYRLKQARGGYFPTFDL